MTQGQDPIYIFGHKNPDADSICAAIAYAEYKKALGYTHYIPARCGNSNARIDVIMDYFGAQLPVYIQDVRPRIKDIMNKDPHKALRQFTCAEALQLINAYDLRALPVVDENNTLIGLTTVFSLGAFYLPSTDAPSDMRYVHQTNIDAIVRTLKGEALNIVDGQSIQDFYVRVGAMDINTFGKFTRGEAIPPEKSVVVVGDRRNIHEKAIEYGIKLLVVSGGSGIDQDVVEKAKKHNINVIRTAFDAATATWLIKSANLLEPIIEEEVYTFEEDDIVKDVRKQISTIASAPLYAVVDEQKKLKGCFTKTDIIKPIKTKIILVDHNELSQAVDGAEDVTIAEIIDHHRIGVPKTETPILFINEPVGSSCTIIADLFRKSNFRLSKQIAGIMMSGIISDTLLLKSPTTTDKDREILPWLAEIAEIKSEDLADTIFNAGSIILSAQPEQIIRTDCKVYKENDLSYSVSQVEELGLANFWDNAEKLQLALDDYCKAECYYMACLLVTDINTQNSLLLVSGDKQFIKAITYNQVKDRIFELPNVVSRKKQLVPYISQLLKTKN